VQIVGYINTNNDFCNPLLSPIISLSENLSDVLFT